VPELIDPNERFGLVFTKTGSINSGTGASSSSGLRSRNISPLLYDLSKERFPFTTVRAGTFKLFFTFLHLIVKFYTG
jgi:hypothetical protein